MRKFKVGDKVKVKEDLEEGYYEDNIGGKLWCSWNMVDYKGQILTITEDVGNGYKVEENSWNWCDKMLEPMSEGKIFIFRK